MFTMDDDSELTTNTMNNKLLQVSCEMINELYCKYENDLYMTSKIHHYISQQLPVILETIKKNREKNVLRIEEHCEQQDQFVNYFLSTNTYYFNNSNEMFFFYKDSNYNAICENDILHHIGTAISEQRNTVLMSWKYKTKTAILKKIKNNLLINTIPESSTIQNVLQYMSGYVCNTKSEAKYILTVIGDNINRKKNSLIHFISGTHKTFFKSLNESCVEFFNCQCTQTFKYKYHEKHKEHHSECRIIPLKTGSYYDDAMINTSCSFLNILCVSCYYSNKNKNSDEYIYEKTEESNLYKHVFKMSKNYPLTIVNQFINEYLVLYGDGETSKMSFSPQEELFLQTYDNEQERFLTWKEIQYLWTDFTLTHGFPSQLYTSFYKTMFCETALVNYYDEKEDIFKNVNSSQIPLIQKFLRFWNTTTTDDESEFAELEIEEIYQLFKIWLNSNSKQTRQTLSESKLLNVLKFFHHDVEIVDDKYICHKRNILWDKEIDIENSLEIIRQQPELITQYDAYYLYQEMHSDNSYSRGLIASKMYFDKYVLCKCPELFKI